MTIFGRRNSIRPPRVAMAALCIALAVGAAGGPNAARAADREPGKASTAEPTPWEFAFGSALMSDYNFRGISVSARRPSVTVYAEPRYKVGSNLELYAGLSASSVDLPNRPAAQIVYAAGIRPRASVTPARRSSAFGRRTPTRRLPSTIGWRSAASSTTLHRGRTRAHPQPTQRLRSRPICRAQCCRRRSADS